MHDILVGADRVASVEGDLEVDRVKYESGVPVALGSDEQSQVVSLEGLTTVTKALRAQGVPFYTSPSLPPPFTN